MSFIPLSYLLFISVDWKPIKKYQFKHVIGQPFKMREAITVSLLDSLLQYILKFGKNEEEWVHFIAFYSL